MEALRLTSVHLQTHHKTQLKFWSFTSVVAHSMRNGQYLHYKTTIQLEQQCVCRKTKCQQWKNKFPISTVITYAYLKWGLEDKYYSEQLQEQQQNSKCKTTYGMMTTVSGPGSNSTGVIDVRRLSPRHPSFPAVNDASGTQLTVM